MPPNRELLQLEEEEGTGQQRVHCLGHRHGVAVHRIGGGGATALKFQRAAKGDSGTALVTALRVAVHRPSEQYPHGRLSVTNG